MAHIHGRGFSGLSTSGPENTKTILMRPDIAGSDSTKYQGRNNGIKIKFVQAKRKSKVVNPRI
jgi:hypothetical protein